MALYKYSVQCKNEHRMYVRMTAHIIRSLSLEVHVRVSLYTELVAHQAGAYPGFCSMKHEATNYFYFYF